MSKSRNILNIISLCAVLGVSGCKQFDIWLKKGSAVADVDIPYKGDVAAVKCTASNSQNCFDGIGHLRNRDWQKAAGELEQAVSKDNKDHKAHFALGVAYEMLNNLNKATEHYKAANFIKGDQEYTRAVDRVETKRKQQEGK